MGRKIVKLSYDQIGAEIMKLEHKILHDININVTKLTKAVCKS